MTLLPYSHIILPPSSPINPHMWRHSRSSNADQHLTLLHHLPPNYISSIFSAETKHHTRVCMQSWVVVLSHGSKHLLAQEEQAKMAIQKWVRSLLQVFNKGRYWLFTRYTNDEEKIRGTRTITPPPTTECRNSRNSSDHPSGYPTNCWTGNSPLSLVSFSFI